MKDRFTRGAVAGIIGALVMNIYNRIIYSLNFTDLRLLDYASIVIFHHKAGNLPEAVEGQLAQLFFSALVGVMLAYFLPLVTSRYYLFKGWFFSVTIWFSVFAIGSALRFPHLISPSWKVVLANFIGASIYGLVAAKSLEWLDDRLKVS